MRIRAAGLVAVWVVIIAVVTASVSTCVPNAMMAMSQTPPGMGTEQPALSAPFAPMDCCVRIQPQIAVTRLDLLRLPARSVLYWLTPVADTARVSIQRTAVPPPSPPDLSALSPPHYIAFSALLI